MLVADSTNADQVANLVSRTRVVLSTAGPAGPGGETAEVALLGQGNPANRITVLCLCESALAIASSSTDLRERDGILIAGTGIKDALVKRLRVVS